MKRDTSPPPRRTRAETRDATRRALLDAAQRCFFAVGYHGATLDAIAAHAGFTKGAVYWHFRNKEALFLELLAEGMTQNVRSGELLLERLARHPDRLEQEVGQWLDHFDAHNKVPLLAIELDFESRHNKSFAALLDSLIVKQQQFASKVLAQYFDMVKREPPIPLDEFAATWIALTKAVALARQTGRSAGLKSTTVIRYLLGLPAECK